MIKLRLTRDDQNKAQYMSFITNIEGQHLTALIFSGNEDKTQVIDRAFKEWAKHNTIMNTLDIVDEKTEHKYTAELVVEIRKKFDNERYGAIIVTAERDNEFTVSKISFDRPIALNDKYDLVLRDLAVIVFDANFI